jgi:hypothetical protein
MKVVRSSPIRTARLYPQECSWYSFLEAESIPSVVSEKSPATPLGIHPETLWLVAQCLNHYATPGPSMMSTVSKWLSWASCDAVCQCDQRFLDTAVVQWSVDQFLLTAIGCPRYWREEILKVLLVRCVCLCARARACARVSLSLHCRGYSHRFARI